MTTAGQESAVLAHTPEQIQAYRTATADARQRQQSGLPPAGSRKRVTQPVPDNRVLPAVHVARQYWGKALQGEVLRAESLRRQAEARPVHFSGNTYGSEARNRMLQANRQQAEVALAGVEKEITRLEKMTDHDVQVWAADRGIR